MVLQVPRYHLFDILIRFVLDLNSNRKFPFKKIITNSSSITSCLWHKVVLVLIGLNKSVYLIDK
jgi:hypothetical protein